MVLEIDSSRGEGGGQMVRTSVALATLTGTTTRLTRIRENRPTNGLSKQHTTAVNAIAQMTGSKITVVMTTQTDKAGNPKIVQKTEMPLTGYHCIDYIVTEMGCFAVTPNGLKLWEIAPGYTPEEVQAKTGAKLIIPENVGSMIKDY